MSIHPTAVVDPGAELGREVQIGPQAYVAGNVRVGDGCVIGPHAVLMPHTTLGRECRIHAGAVVGDLPQDLGFKSAVSHVRIGDHCVLREGVTVHRGTQPESVTELGEGCYLMANSHVAHNCVVGRNVIMANNALLGGHVQVGDRVFISGNAAAHQFVRIGRLAMIGGLSGLSKDVPPFCTLRTQSFNKILGLNVVGMRRAGLQPADRAIVKQCFHLLYRSGLNVSQAMAETRKTLGNHPLAREWIDFVEASKRGICSLRADEAADGKEA